MAYLLLAIGLMIGAVALYRFFLNANIKQIKAAFMVVCLAAIAIAMFYLSVTGRLPAAIALVVAIVPFVLSYLKAKAAGHSGRGAPHNNTSSTNKPMTHDEALEVLGLKKGASIDMIKDTYKKLMKKVHPDQEGSEWMAAKLNEAKDLLLRDKE